MNFVSWEFWLLFALVISCYWKLERRQQNRLLLVASYLFYGFWDYRFLFLILISTVIDFIGGLGVAGVQLPRKKLRGLGALVIGSSLLVCSRVRYADLFQALRQSDWNRCLAALPHQFSDYYVTIGVVTLVLGYAICLPYLYALPTDRRRKTFLTISMVANLGLLGFFKYFDFFITNFQQLLTALGLGHGHIAVLGILLPAGISFYTFQAMSYTIDIYRKELEPTESLSDFALFISFFPHLVAGPIMRAHTLLPQILCARQMKPGDIEEGFMLVLLGLFKKIVIADNMAPLANAVFFRFADGNAAGLTGADVLTALYAFAFQIYGDFSGYSSIARGVSKWLGFELVINFDQPYLSASPPQFWRRWHISLSSWLRDYLYIPLGGNRHGAWKTYRNLFLTMTLCGLWHGANWTYILFGIYYGVLLALWRALKINDEIDTRRWAGKLAFAGRVLLTFHLVCFGWLIFRADNLSMIWQMTGRLIANFQISQAAMITGLLVLLYSGLLMLLEWRWNGEKNLRPQTEGFWLWRTAVYAYLLAGLLIFHADGTYEFIYFQF